MNCNAYINKYTTIEHPNRILSPSFSLFTIINTSMYVRTGMNHDDVYRSIVANISALFLLLESMKRGKIQRERERYFDLRLSVAAATPVFACIHTFSHAASQEDKQ